MPATNLRFLHFNLFFTGDAARFQKYSGSVEACQLQRAPRPGGAILQLVPKATSGPDAACYSVRIRASVATSNALATFVVRVQGRAPRLKITAERAFWAA